MKIAATVLTALAAVFILCSATPERTTRPGRLRVRASAPTEVSAAAAADTVAVADGVFVISGYDKPLRSAGESFFITNRGEEPVTAIELRIRYFDVRKRQLHERTLWVGVNLPGRATRRVDISSWDKRQTFYYVKGVQPRRDGATPFDVSVTPLRVVR